MTRVLYMTDHNKMSGFGYVADKVCDGLARKYGQGEVWMLGWGFRANEPLNRGSYAVLPCGDHPCGADVLPNILNQIQPEIFITQDDTRNLLGWFEQLADDKSRQFHWINYPVIDGYIWQINGVKTKWSSNWVQFMKKADYTVAMSEFGGKILESNGIKNIVIPHGVETETFKPLPPEARSEIRKNNNLAEKFVVLGVFKNMSRKMPDKWLQVLRLFKEGKKDVVGVLHVNAAPEFGGEFNMFQLALDYGLEIGKDVMFSGVGVPRQNMVGMYGMADCFLHTGFGEGFGLPVIEAMACGLPVVGTNSTTAPELIGDCGLLIDTVKYPKTNQEITFGSYNGVEFSMPNIYDAAEKLDRLYNNKSLREELSIKSAQKAVSKYDWSVILPMWEEAIKNATGIQNLPEEWQKLVQTIQDKKVEKEESGSE